MSTLHYTASMAVIDPEMKSVLLIHHRRTGFWQIPGGHIDPNEMPHEAALREVEEETGIRPRLLTRREPEIDPGYGTFMPVPYLISRIPSPPRHDDPTHLHLDFIFAGTADSAALLRENPEETAGVAWFGLEALTRDIVRDDVDSTVRIAMGTYALW